MNAVFDTHSVTLQQSPSPNCPASFDWLDYPELDSTNTQAKRLLTEGHIQRLTCISTPCQTAGRGTHGRQWSSPPGSGWTFSWVQPDRPLNPKYTLATARACVKAFQSLYQLSVDIKPVNDLYIHGCKLGGILTESIPRRNMPPDPNRVALITGIGINVRDIPREIHASETGRPVIQPIALQTVLSAETFAQVSLKDFLEAFLPLWLAEQATL